MTVPGRYSPDAASAGRRALRNVALDLLAANGAPDAIARAARQYDAADNMTDRMAALATLSLHDVPERERALADFYTALCVRRAGDRQMVLAAGHDPGGDTLDNVRALTGHPAFSIANPNRVRALIGAFAQGNPTQFNRADGAGYDFRRRYRAGARSEKPASGRAPGDRLPHLAHAGSRPPRQGGSRARPHQGRVRLCRATLPISSSARWPRPERPAGDQYRA